MEIEGTEYRLETNNGGNHLHGGTKGLPPTAACGRDAWRRTAWSCRSSPEDGDQGYPGTLAVEAVFDFDDDNSLEITYLARTDRTTVVNLTNHVYFNLSGRGVGRRARPRTAAQCLAGPRNGRTPDPHGPPPRRGRHAAGFPHVPRVPPRHRRRLQPHPRLPGLRPPLPLDGWRPGILGEAATLRDPHSGRTVTVLTSQPSVMVYTGNWLAGLSRNEVGRPLPRPCGRGARMPEPPRRREPARVPVAAAAPGRALLPEDRIPLRHPVDSRATRPDRPRRSSFSPDPTRARRGLAAQVRHRPPRPQSPRQLDSRQPARRPRIPDSAGTCGAPIRTIPQHACTGEHRPRNRPNPRTQNPNSYSHRPVPRKSAPEKKTSGADVRATACRRAVRACRNRPCGATGRRINREKICNSPLLSLPLPRIHKGCLTIRLRLYPLYRIRVMPRPGHVFPHHPLFSVL